MESICARCSRLALRSQRQILCTNQSANSKGFTTSVYQRAEDNTKASKSNNTPTARPVQNATKTSSGTTPINSQPQLLIRRVAHDGPSKPSNTRAPAPRAPGQLLRRVGASGPPGPVLRRSGPPGQGTGQRGPQKRGDGKAPGRDRRRRAVANEFGDQNDGIKDDERVTDEDMDDYITAHIDPPANPTERLDYDPVPQQLSELQKDWPNTPMSAAGLSATVVQKLESLAGRLPHGYQTPGQLADDFVDGRLMRFESEEERQKVIEVATELAKKRADEQSEREGSVVAAEDMGFVDLNAGSQKNKILNETVKGEIGQLERQRMPFLDSVMRNLRNNQTYHQNEMAGFMATVQKLMPAQTQRRPQQQAQKN